uniref:Protein S-acyltransferase n=1 Tax=Bursaphelenchus xylophilus TaxID=6326 RepID=A0A1I7S067_BURXY
MIRNNEYISLTELQERQRIEDRKTKRIIGKVCPFLVYGLLSFVVLNIIFIFLPFESLYKPLWLVIMLCMMTVYFVSSIVFSYYMACNTHPGSPRKGKRSFCAQEKLFFVSWRDTLCYSNYLVAIPVAIVFLLCLQIFAFAGFLFWQNFSMISFGILYIESLKSDKKSSLQMYLWPFGAPNFTKNWRNFLGLHFGRRFWSHILLPSTHKPFFHEEYTPPMCNL